MAALSTLTFAVPWLLAGLAVLPLLFIFLRVQPPAPRVIAFPPIALLAGLVPERARAQRTPWWLILLRLLIAGLLIVSFAGPRLDSGRDLPGQGPLLLVVDNGWAAAADWPARQAEAMAAVTRAGLTGRPVWVMPTASPAPPGPLSPAAAATAVRALTPRPWATDRAAVIATLERRMAPPAGSLWIYDGAGSGAAALAQATARFGPLVVRQTKRAPLVLDTPTEGPAGLNLSVRRPPGAAAWQGALRATAEDGRELWRGPLTFAAGAVRAEVTIDLPLVLRNQITRVAIDGVAGAASVILLDERFRRRGVGLLSDQAIKDRRSLLDGEYYLIRALTPFAALEHGDVAALTAANGPSMILLEDRVLTPAAAGNLRDWMGGGGVLVRFAGPNLAAAGDDLLPVRLRRGDRAFGGALTWTAPARLAPFPPTSPFAGLTLSPEVTVNRQVLAEPSLDLSERSWARLDDGTPLVTARPVDKGWLVLFHTTANTAWSNLALSGLFVDMLRRLSSLGRGRVDKDRPRARPPLATLDGFGRLGPPPAGARPLPAGSAAVAVGPDHPPGFYGRQGQREAVNLGPTLGSLTAPAPLAVADRVGGFEGDSLRDLRGPLLAAALVLAMCDVLASLALGGWLRPVARGGAAVLGLVFAVTWLFTVAPAAAQSGGGRPVDDKTLAAGLETRLAYIRTGDTTIDRISAAGLSALSAVVGQRTAVEPGAPLAIDPARDALALLPLIYWPITERQKPLSSTATARLNAYMRNGGMILIDTRDQWASGFSARGPGLELLQRLTDGLAIPDLAAVDNDHVLTRSFYLLSGLPGRFRGGRVWVGADREMVSPVVVGRHDWAAAWARDAAGRPLFAVEPGGDLQREMAFRFGVNLVMYALTGNYKADQVHVPAILERLGQ